MRLAVPAVAAVVALAGAGIAFTGLDSAEAGEAPAVSLAPPQTSSVSQDELAQRAVKAMAADARTKAPSPAARSLAKSAPSARIIGGKETTISSAPWMAQLHFWDSQGGYFCGGVVIAPTKVATAAHCVQGIRWYSDGVVIVGTDQMPAENGDLHGGVAHIVKRQWHNPQYDAYTLDNDVAVLTLEKPVSVPSLPIAQPTDGALYQAGLDGKVYGWGRTSSTDPNSGSNILKVADADVVSDSNCAAAYPAPTETAAKFVAGDMLCAGAAPTGSDATTESTCNGDSGGPLVVGGKLVGLVSWGDVNCSAAGKYGVYAKVSKYSAPIQARVDDANRNRDHTGDLMARRASDSTLFGWTSKVTSFARTVNAGSFAGNNLMVQCDLDRDDNEDLLVRASNGSVYWDHYVPATGKTERKLISSGWRTNKQLLVPGDLTGDEVPDLLTVNSTGYLYLYPGRGNGSFSAPVLLGSGWGQYREVRGHGDFTNDGTPDVIARGSDGSTYLYKGTGKTSAPIEARRLVGKFTTGSFNTLVTVGDVNSDGHADLLARDSAGKLWLYPGNGNGAPTGSIFGARKDFGVGWQAYNLFG